MTTASKTTITVESSIQAPIEKVWAYWTEPKHIRQWNNASDDWHTPYAENDLRVGGKFVSRMEAKDGSIGFDFGGIYNVIRINEYIEYTLGDNRKVKINFSSRGNESKIIETFDIENENPPEMQQAGWQAILNNFKKYTEAN